MVKKTAMEERTEKLEQEMESLALEVRANNADVRQCLEELLRRTRNPKRRPRKGERRRETAEVENEQGEGSTTESEHDTVSDSQVTRHKYQGRRLEIPVFEGGEAYGWLAKVERYFRINGVEEEEMLEAVIIALDGRALNWYQWWEEQLPNPSWEEFKQAVLRRFQPAMARNPLGPILNVKQKGTVMEYREKFEELMAPLKRNERGMLESIFLNGLCEEIQAELKLHNTRGLNSMMDRALLIEERNQAMYQDQVKTKEKNKGNKWKSSPSGNGSQTKNSSWTQ